MFWLKTIFPTVLTAGFSLFMYSKVFNDQYRLGDLKKMNLTLLENQLQKEMREPPFVSSYSFLNIFRDFYSQNDQPLVLFFQGGKGMIESD